MVGVAGSGVGVCGVGMSVDKANIIDAGLGTGVGDVGKSGRGMTGVGVGMVGFTMDMGSVVEACVGVDVGVQGVW